LYLVLVISVLRIEGLFAFGQDLLSVTFDRRGESHTHIGIDRLAGGPTLAVRRTAMALRSRQLVGLPTGGSQASGGPAAGATGEMIGAEAEAAVARFTTAIILRRPGRGREPRNTIANQHRLQGFTLESRAVVAGCHCWLVQQCRFG
jgi:hypothetical protein